MKLVEFLIEILDAHAKTLQKLAILLGEEDLVEILEKAGETEPNIQTSFYIDAKWFDPVENQDQASSYLRLESAVDEFHLNASLKFYLWTYPFYRTIIENSFHLKSKIRFSEELPSLVLIEECVRQGRIWIHNLPIPPEHSRQAEAASSVTWIRFRAQVFKKIGRNVLELTSA